MESVRASPGLLRDPGLSGWVGGTRRELGRRVCADHEQRGVQFWLRGGGRRRGAGSKCRVCGAPSLEAAPATLQPRSDRVC